MASKGAAVVVLVAVAGALLLLARRRDGDAGGFVSIGWPFRKLEPSTQIVSVAGLRG